MCVCAGGWKFAFPGPAKIECRKHGISADRVLTQRRQRPLVRRSTDSAFVDVERPSSAEDGSHTVDLDIQTVSDIAFRAVSDWVPAAKDRPLNKPLSRL